MHPIIRGRVGSTGPRVVATKVLRLAPAVLARYVGTYDEQAPFWRSVQVSGAPRFLISEAIRGEGARLVNARGEAFMTRYHELGDLAPRDVVARSMVREAERTGGPVALSLAHLDPARVRERFPTIAAACRDAGLDLTSDRVPVGPAAHYVMGGIDTDVDGRTSLDISAFRLDRFRP